MKNRFLFCVFSIIMFLIMCVVVYYHDRYCPVLEVKSSNTFALDFNHDKIADKKEWVVLENAKVVTEDDLSEKELFIFYQLAKRFAEDFFFNKNVKFVNGDVVVDGKSYSESFNKAGFNALTAPDEYKKKVEYIKNNVFYVLNLHNMRYHRYGCSHYLRSENYAAYEKSELPQKSIPCSYCNKELIVKNNSKFVKSDDIKLFLTDFTKQLTPQRACSSNVCKELLAQVKLSQKTIDMAIYGYNEIPEIEKALLAAKRRGVKIRMVYDLNSKGETDYSDSIRLANMLGCAVSDYNAEQGNGKYSNIIMHNKFYIFDDKTVVTGSANLSPNDMSGFSANATLTINSTDVAKVYKNEFEQMWASKFHNLKTKDLNRQNIKLGDSSVNVYFSPQDRITKNYVIPLVKKSKETILMPTFLITDRMLADELIAARNRGVDVRVILDATSAGSPYSQMKKLRDAGVLVKVENYAGKLHSKSIIIDSKISIIGSMNFSKSGQNFNDENVVIIENPLIANIYTQYFDNLWAKIDERWLKYTPRAESKESFGSCNDGIDNDYDGLIDEADTSCQ